MKQFLDLSVKNTKWELEDVYREEEKYWKTRSKEKWLKHGDQNTKFFHGSVQRRRALNKKISLIDDNGVKCFEEGSKKDINVRYFQRMFTTSNPTDPSELLDGLLPRVTAIMNDELIKDVSAEEIKQAAFSIKGSATPGADGMNEVCFKLIGLWWENRLLRMSDNFLRLTFCLINGILPNW